MDFFTDYKLVLVQCLGILAMCISLLGYIFKKDETAFISLIIGKLFWITHFLFLGAYPAVIGASVGFFRVFLALKYKKNKLLFGIILFITIILGYFSYTDIYSSFPIIGSCISAYSYFFCKGIPLRMFILLTSLFWLLFNIHIQSIGGIINEILIQILTISTIYRIGKEKK